MRDDALLMMFPQGYGARADERTKLLWRQQADTTGRCPVCGATSGQPNRAERRALRRRYGPAVQHRIFDHDQRCPVGDGAAS